MTSFALTGIIHTHSQQRGLADCTWSAMPALPLGFAFFPRGKRSQQTIYLQKQSKTKSNKADL